MLPGVRNGNSLQYSCLENSMDRGAWWATVHGVTELDTAEQLSLHLNAYHVPGTMWDVLCISMHLFHRMWDKDVPIFSSLFIWFLAALVLCCCAWASSSGREWGLLSSCSVWALLWLLLFWSMSSRAWAQKLWFMGLVAPWHVDSSQTRDQTHVPCIGRQILNHWTSREVWESPFFGWRNWGT